MKINALIYEIERKRKFTNENLRDLYYSKHRLIVKVQSKENLTELNADIVIILKSSCSVKDITSDTNNLYLRVNASIILA